MNVAEIELQNHLRQHGYSMTKPRSVVFTALEDQEAITMTELVAACSGKLDRATVYLSLIHI